MNNRLTINTLVGKRVFCTSCRLNADIKKSDSESNSDAFQEKFVYQSRVKGKWDSSTVPDTVSDEVTDTNILNWERIPTFVWLV